MATVQGITRAALQRDFSGGVWPSVREDLIPENGVQDCINGLLDNTGGIYRRGGSTYRSSSTFTAATWLPFIWDGYLAGGVQRTVIASTVGIGLLNDDGSTTQISGVGVSGPQRVAVLNGAMYFPGGQVYAGASGAAYSTGTVTVTGASPTVIGAGTTWSGNVSPGMIFTVAGRPYVIQSVDSNTQLTLSTPYGGSNGAGLAYSAGPTATAAKVGAFYATVGDRLFVGQNDRVDLADIGDPSSFNPTDFHRIPEGVRILGLQGLRDALVVFTSGGVWILSNLSLDLTDADGNMQHRVDRFSRDLVLWGDAGIAAWEGGLVVPALDDVWVMSYGVASEAPVPFQRVSEPVSRLYREYVANGYTPGQACVYRGHYLLPILSGETVVDQLVCRLDRQGTPWTRLGGFGGKVAALTIRAGATPSLLGASGASGRVLNLHYFEPSLLYARDADKSSHDWEVQLRDYATGTLNENTILRLKMAYDLGEIPVESIPVPVETFWGEFDWGQADWGTGTDDLFHEGEPVIRAAELIGDTPPGQTTWGMFDWGQADWGEASTVEFLSPDAPVDELGREPHTWTVAKRRRFGRFRLECRLATSHLTLRWVEMQVRSQGRI